MGHRRSRFAFLALFLCACSTGPADVNPEPPPEGGKADGIFGPGRRMPDPTAGLRPMLPSSELVEVASLPTPPGNVAVSRAGRVFLSYMPEAPQRGPEVRVAELVDGVPVPYPSVALQKQLRSVLGIKIDRQDRLWLLDYAGLAFLADPKLYAIDLATDQVVFTHAFGADVAPAGTLLNDLAISPDGKLLFLSDPSPLAGSPAIVVVDLRGPKPVVRRRLERDPSVGDGPWDVFVHGEVFKVKGLLPVQGVDGLVLDERGEWLTYLSVNAGALSRVRTADLLDDKLDDAALSARVERRGPASMSDGITADLAGHVYLSDMEHSQIVRAAPDGTLAILVKDARLRWPDGFSWAPDGALYVTASAINEFLPKLIVTAGDIERRGPYSIFKIEPQRACASTQRCSGWLDEASAP